MEHGPFGGRDGCTRMKRDFRVKEKRDGTLRKMGVLNESDQETNYFNIRVNPFHPRKSVFHLFLGWRIPFVQEAASVFHSFAKAAEENEITRRAEGKMKP